ncbi:MAG: TonB-dependent receptor plug domain-containing protein, partial [Thiomicrospira sp.]
MRYHPLYAALMSAFALSATAAHAHDHPAHHDHSALPAVEVEQAAAVETFEHDIDMDYLSRTQANDLQDTFKLSPSVQVGTGSRNGQKLFVRGVEDLNVNIKIDGARQGANVFHHQSRVQIDPFILKQVRVYTGPASADAGAGALGGSVVFDTVDAQDLLQPGKTIGARLGGQYESASNLKGGLVSVYGQLGEHLGLLAYGRRNTNENVRVGGGEMLKSTEGAYEDYLLKASLLDVDGHSLRLSAQRNQNDGGPLRANYPWQTNQGTIRGDDNQRMYDERQALRYAYKPNQQAWLDVQFDMYRSETGLQRFTTNLGPPPNN